MSGAQERTRTSTVLPTATSRQRVYQFRHDRIASANCFVRGKRERGIV